LISNCQFLSSLALIVGLSLSLSSCSSNTKQNSTKLTLTGSSSVAPLAGEIAKRFESEHPGVRIDVQTGGSSRGIADASQGVVDIGMVSRDLKDSETQELKSFTIARDGISMIINKDNSIASLSDEEIKQIYQDKINNWQEVKGKNAPITVVSKAEGRSTLELFLQYFELENSQIKADTIIGDNQQGIKTVAGNPNAIGYVSIGAAEYEIDRGVPIKLLPIGGIESSTKTIQDGTFPLSRPLNLVTKETPTGLTQEFIEYAQSPKVADLVKAQNFVPIVK
jgi:phosphate transport system substrate-binding protein